MITVRTRQQLIAHLNSELKRDDLKPETRKAVANRLKQTVGKLKRPKRKLYGPRLIAGESHYTTAEWRAMQKRRKTAQRSRRRNRRG